jgi:soluble lytic murein transglycosylase-like protein
MPTLPPIPQDTWDEHVTTQTDKAVSDGFAALDSARAAQDQARQAEQIATAREQEESAQSAQAQLTAVLQPARDAQATAVGAQQAQDQLDSILAPARAAQQQASQAGGALPPATAGPPQSTGAGIRTQSLDGSIDPGSTDWRAYAAEAAQKAGIDPALFQRQIQQESGFDPTAHSGAGAQGIAQIVPSAHPGVDPMNPKAALDYAANWMRQLTDRYGGDARKALAAYNAGPGAVDTYGGVPPFEETQRYVKTIYDDAQAGGQAGALAPPPVPGQEASSVVQQRAPGRIEAVGQFEQGLPADEASAICGPVAALAFAQANGRNPDLAEARALAKQVGWTSTGGMNGVANEQALLTKMGVKSRLDTNPDFGHIAQDAASGNPVIISTPVHYYYASDYDPSTGKVFVGKTGTSRRGGGSWMTPQEIATLDGGINGALFVDNPQSPTPSVGASADTGGDRPPSEFEQPSQFQGDRYLGRRPDQPITMGDVGDPTIAAGLPRTPLEALDAGATAVEGQISRSNQGFGDDVAASGDYLRAVQHGGTATPEQEARAWEAPQNLAMSLSGEPLAAVGTAGRAALGIERAASATRQGGMSLEEALPPLSSITDNYRKPLSAYTSRVFHETDAGRADEFLPVPGGFGRTETETYLATSPDLALGQGGKRGVLLEFDAAPIQGQVNTRKPTWQPLWESGDAEFIARHNEGRAYQDALRSVTVTPEIAGTPGERMRLKRNLAHLERAGWEQTTNADGSTTYTRPAAPSETRQPGMSLMPAGGAAARAGEAGSAAVGPAISAAGLLGGGAAGYATAPAQRPDEPDAAYAARVFAQTAAGGAVGLAGAIGAQQLAQRLNLPARVVEEATVAPSSSAGFQPVLEPRAQRDRAQGEAGKELGQGSATGATAPRRWPASWTSADADRAEAHRGLRATSSTPPRGRASARTRSWPSRRRVGRRPPVRRVPPRQGGRPRHRPPRQLLPARLRGRARSRGRAGRTRSSTSSQTGRRDGEPRRRRPPLRAGRARNRRYGEPRSRAQRRPAVLPARQGRAVQPGRLPRGGGQPHQRRSRRSGRRTPMRWRSSTGSGRTARATPVRPRLCSTSAVGATKYGELQQRGQPGCARVNTVASLGLSAITNVGPEVNTATVAGLRADGAERPGSALSSPEARSTRSRPA